MLIGGQRIVSDGAAVQAGMAAAQAAQQVQAMQGRVHFMDAQSAAAFSVQMTTAVETEVFNVEKYPIKYAQIAPVSTVHDPWIQSITEYSYEAYGEARRMAGGARDFPLVSDTMSEHTRNVFMDGIGYDYSLRDQNLDRLTLLGRLTQRALHAREIGEKKLESICLVGDTENNLEGMFNLSSVTPVNVPATGTGSSRLWADKTDEQKRTDLNLALSASYTATGEVEIADSIALPPSAHNDIVNARVGDNSTLKSWILANNLLPEGRPLRIVTHPDLETAGAGGTRRMVTYSNDPRKCVFNVPMPFQFLPAWPSSPMSFVVGGIFASAGFYARYPGSVRYHDGF